MNHILADQNYSLKLVYKYIYVGNKSKQKIERKLNKQSKVWAGCWTYETLEKPEIRDKGNMLERLLIAHFLY